MKKLLTILAACVAATALGQGFAIRSLNGLGTNTTLRTPTLFSGTNAGHFLVESNVVIGKVLRNSQSTVNLDASSQIGFAWGIGNLTDGGASGVFGGAGNNAHGDTSVVVGGRFNTNNGDLATVLVGGYSNKIDSVNTAVILGGWYNFIDNDESFVVGGTSNTVSGLNSGILGGRNNTVSPNALSTVVIGGQNNTIGGSNHVAFGVGLSVNATNQLSVGGDLLVTGTMTGNGSGLTNLDASSLASGTVPPARMSQYQTNLYVFGSGAGTNYTYTDTAGWHNTNTSAANQGVDISQGNVTVQGNQTNNGTVTIVNNGVQSLFNSNNITTGTNTVTGRLLIADGSSVGPSIAFSSSSGVGIYKSGSSFGIAGTVVLNDSTTYFANTAGARSQVGGANWELTAGGASTNRQLVLSGTNVWATTNLTVSGSVTATNGIQGANGYMCMGTGIVSVATSASTNLFFGFSTARSFGDIGVETNASFVVTNARPANSLRLIFGSGIRGNNTDVVTLYVATNHVLMTEVCVEAVTAGTAYETGFKSVVFPALPANCRISLYAGNNAANATLLKNTVFDLGGAN